MNIFLYDHTFEGLLTSVFEAYSRRTCLLYTSDAADE